MLPCKVEYDSQDELEADDVSDLRDDQHDLTSLSDEENTTDTDDDWTPANGVCCAHLVLVTPQHTNVIQNKQVQPASYTGYINKWMVCSLAHTTSFITYRFWTDITNKDHLINYHADSDATNNHAINNNANNDDNDAINNNATNDDNNATNNAATNNAATNNEAAHNEDTNNDATHNEDTNNDATHNKDTNNDATHNKDTNNDATHNEDTNNDTANNYMANNYPTNNATNDYTTDNNVNNTNNNGEAYTVHGGAIAMSLVGADLDLDDSFQPAPRKRRRFTPRRFPDLE
jgi:hypothetical protein